MRSVVDENLVMTATTPPESARRNTPGGSVRISPPTLGHGGYSRIDHSSPSSCPPMYRNTHPLHVLDQLPPPSESQSSILNFGM